jgi:hypothetical protein
MHWGGGGAEKKACVAPPVDSVVEDLDSFRSSAPRGLHAMGRGRRQMGLLGDCSQCYPAVISFARSEVKQINPKKKNHRSNKFQAVDMSLPDIIFL